MKTVESNYSRVTKQLDEKTIEKQLDVILEPCIVFPTKSERFLIGSH